MSSEITDLIGIAGIIREMRETWLAKKKWPIEERRSLLEDLNRQLELVSKVLALAERYHLSHQEIVAFMAGDCACYVIHLEHTLKILPKNS